jgi:hypothetical protein
MPAAYRNFCMGPDGRLRAPDKKTRVQRPVCGADIDSANAVGIFFLSIALTFIGFSPDTSM